MFPIVTLFEEVFNPDISVRREKAKSFSGCKSHPATFAPAGSNRSGGGSNPVVEASGAEGDAKSLGDCAGRNASERRAGLETGNAEADPAEIRGRLSSRGVTSDQDSAVPPG